MSLIIVHTTHTLFVVDVYTQHAHYSFRSGGIQLYRYRRARELSWHRQRNQPFATMQPPISTKLQPNSFNKLTRY